MNTLMDDKSAGVIVPGMKMPDSCMACPFCIWDATRQQHECMFTHVVITSSKCKFSRLTSCILKPVELK